MLCIPVFVIIKPIYLKSEKCKRDLIRMINNITFYKKKKTYISPKDPVITLYASSLNQKWNNAFKQKQNSQN